MNKIIKIVLGLMVSLEMLLATQSVTELSSDTFEKTLKNNKSTLHPSGNTLHPSGKNSTFVI